MNEKAINFFQGKICVRNEDGSFEFMDDSCIPIFKQKIDEYINNNPTTFSTKSIIFSVLKDLFGIAKRFVPPHSRNSVPYSDPLYNELLHYISSNPTYSERLNKKIKLNFQRKKAYDEYRDKNLEYNYYKKSKVDHFCREILVYGKRG